MPVELRALQALRLWHDVHLDRVRDAEPDLSSRQIAILLTIYLETPPHTVRGLAKKLGVTKPVITRALDTMGKLDLVSRRRDEDHPQCRHPAHRGGGAGHRTPGRHDHRPRQEFAMSFDRRITPFRPDLADERLRGRVEADASPPAGSAA